jgi:hypothetical protein
MGSIYNRIQKLCTPAYVYLVISSIVLILMTLQNVGDNTLYCAGNYSCSVSNKVLLFIINILYIVFWTWILNLICDSGASIVSWILVLLPIVLMFLIIAYFLLTGKNVMANISYI